MLAGLPCNTRKCLVLWFGTFLVPHHGWSCTPISLRDCLPPDYWAVWRESLMKDFYSSVVALFNQSQTLNLPTKLCESSYLHTHMEGNFLLTCFPYKPLLFSSHKTSQRQKLGQRSTPVPQISVYLSMEVHSLTVGSDQRQDSLPCTALQWSIGTHYRCLIPDRAYKIFILIII